MCARTDPEQAVHGASWAQMHGGYFADPVIARPLVAAVHEIQARDRPDVVVDLGGGTGFLLVQLRACGAGKGTALVDLDCSPAQLQVARESGLAVVNGTMDSFRRVEVVPDGARAMYVMRSVLHYAGEAGLAPLLRHVRAQARPGEYWIHQTACFDADNDAACLNSLYRRMRTGKWYPTAVRLRALLHAAGWEVVSSAPAPVLQLGSGELALRYGLTAAEIESIRRDMVRDFGTDHPVFRSNGAGFTADLRYQIFVCRALA